MSRRDNRAVRRAYREAQAQADALAMIRDPAATETHLRAVCAADGGVWDAARSLVMSATGVDRRHADSVAARMIGGEMLASIAAPHLAACRSRGLHEQTAGHRTRRCRGM